MWLVIKSSFSLFYEYGGEIDGDDGGMCVCERACDIKLIVSITIEFFLNEFPLIQRIQ